MRKRIVLGILISFFLLSTLSAASSFSGYAGGRLNYAANPEKEQYDPDLKLQAFFIIIQVKQLDIKNLLAEQVRLCYKFEAQVPSLKLCKRPIPVQLVKQVICDNPRKLVYILFKFKPFVDRAVEICYNPVNIIHITV